MTKAVAIDHLPSWFQRAWTIESPVKIRFSDASSVSIHAAAGRYASELNFDNWTSLNRREVDVAALEPLSHSIASDFDKPLTHLYWALSLNRFLEQAGTYSHRFALAHWVSWPSLTHLPHGVVPHAARICALLTRKPTAVSLIPLVLDAPENEVFAVVETLRMGGHIQLTGRRASDNPDAPPRVSPEVTTGTKVTPSQDFIPAPAATLIGKLWRRLLNREG